VTIYVYMPYELGDEPVVVNGDYQVGGVNHDNSPTAGAVDSLQDFVTRNTRQGAVYFTDDPEVDLFGKPTTTTHDRLIIECTIPNGDDWYTYQVVDEPGFEQDAREAAERWTRESKDGTRFRLVRHTTTTKVEVI
jgi:hypothetical protein